jgi:broad-specificity NMP kinase
MFARATDKELIEKLDKRGYKEEKNPVEFWKEE